MKRILLASAWALFCGLAFTAHSQIYSQNVIGYCTLSLYAGNNWIANQLDDMKADGNALNTVLLGVPGGSTFTKWDSAANQFLPVSVFNAQSQSWSINYSFNLLEGGVLHSPVSGSTTFVGEVNQTYYSFGPSEGFQYQNYPHYAPGLYLLGCPVPYEGATFTDVIGRAPQDGEWVETLDNATQTYTVTTFHALTGNWDNGVPSLAVGQAAFFDLGPATVPEPSALALAGLGTVLALCRRCRRGA